MGAALTAPPAAREGRFLAVVMLIGLAARVASWWVQGGMHHADEMFQYLEPANERLTGLGWLPWEFGTGVRSWTLPAFYGAWMWWGQQLGLDGFAIHRLLMLHNALWSLLLVPATYRLAKTCGDLRAGQVAALMTALFLPILYYMPHTLSEVPSTLLTTWATVWWLESRQDAKRWWPLLLAGAALGAATMFRATSAAWALVPAVSLGASRHGRKLVAYALGGAAMVALSGLIDLLTWGSFLHATINYVDYNLITNQAIRFGVEPWWFYLRFWLWQRTVWGGLVMLGTALLAPRRTGWLLAAFLVPLVAFSAVSHKEDRFLLGNYPLLLAVGAVGFSALGQRLRGRWQRLVMAGAVVTVLASGAWGSRRLEWRAFAGTFEAQRWVGHQPDARGVLIVEELCFNGGYLVLDRNIPEQRFYKLMMRSPLYNYLILWTGSPDTWDLAAFGFEPVASFQGVTVFHHPD